MDIWLDTTNTETIQQAVRFGLLSGVTTNPSLIAQSNIDLEEILENLLVSQEGPVAAQVEAQGALDMVQQGQILRSISNRIIVKVPVTKNGLEALHLLSRQSIPTMATIIFHPHQALLAALAGADFVAPYLGRIEKKGGDPWNMLKSIVQMFQSYKLKTKILGASLQSIEHFNRCAEAGIDAVTLKEGLFQQLIESDPSTLEVMHAFNNDWQKINPSLFSLNMR